MLAVLWIRDTREAYSFPTLLKGALALKRADDTMSLTLTGVTKHTWEGYHGKPLPAGDLEKILWEPHDDVAYDNLRLDKMGVRKIHCSTEDGSERICIEFLPE